VFFTGVVIGSFLVLKSAVSEGQIFNITNEPEENKGGALSELGAIQKLLPEDLGSYDKNLTDDFLKTIAFEGVYQELDEAGYTSEEFLESTVFPYFIENQQTVLNPDSDFKINTSVNKDLREYVDEMSIQVLILAGAWQRVMVADIETLDTPEVRESFKKLTELLTINDNELQNKYVPPQYVEFHKKVLQLSSAVQTMISDGVLNKTTDPLKSILVIASLEEISNFGQEVIAELALIDDIIR